MQQAEGNPNYPFLILIETQGSNDSHDKAKLENFLSEGMESDIIIDGVLAQDGKQINEM